MTQPKSKTLLTAFIFLIIALGSFLVIMAPDIFTSEKDYFTQEELIEDTEQLIEIIERTHPDPYIRSGGKIAFHRNSQKILDSIPKEGLSRDEFARLLHPFIASINDGHTLLENAYSIDKLYPGGVPLLFNVVEESLYVAGVAGEENKELIGSILLSVEGIPLTELIERQKKWRGIENTYHALYFLSSQSLLYYPYMKDLLPEWDNVQQVIIEVQLPTGNIQEFSFDLPVRADTLYIPESQVNLPIPGEAGFLYDFLDQEKQFAYLRIDHMQGYREMFERRSDSKAENYPSATQKFSELVMDMEEAKTELLIIDLRDCVGGNSTMSDILIYFLYGKDALQYVKSAAYAAGGGSVFKTPPSSKKRDYDFAWDFTDNIEKFQDLSPQIPALLEDFSKEMPTFYVEFKTGTYESYYLPKQIAVLVSPKTFSSGFVMARYFYLTNAALVGTPSSQALNWFCDPIYVSLNNSEIKVLVSTTYCNHLLPDEPDLVDVLPVHYPMTFEILKSYDFDSNAEVLYTIDLFTNMEQ